MSKGLSQMKETERKEAIKRRIKEHGTYPGLGTLAALDAENNTKTKKKGSKE